MSRYQVAYQASTKEAVVQPYGADTIAGHTNIGNFYHDGGGADVLAAGGPESHVLYHHIQELLYKAGEQNMQAVKIVFKHVTAIDATATDVAMNLTTDTTEQIATAFTPADASNKDLLYSSSDITKATISATGLITAVALGTAVITVTSKDSGVTDQISVTVS